MQALMSYRIQSCPFLSVRRRIKLVRAVVAMLVAIASACSSQAQEPGPSTLWSVYFSAAAAAAKADNWPEAEALFAAAVEQAQQHQPAEPYLTFAKYSLAIAYYQQGRYADANRTAAPLKLAVDPATVHADLQESVDALTTLGNLFYNQAEKESDDPKRKELQGDARTKADDDISEKNFFARRYYQWAFVIDQQLLPADSPDLAGPAEWVGLMNYKVGDYSAAVASLTQLMRIQEMTAQREKALSSGSMAYSLASRQDTGQAKNPQAPAAAVGIYIGLSYEAVADGLSKDKPAEAAQALAQGEPYLEKYVDDAPFGKSARTVLLRLYETHAGLLIRLKDPAAAATLEKKAKLLKARQEKPS